jgi:hypothetical protein
VDQLLTLISNGWKRAPLGTYILLFIHNKTEASTIEIAESLNWDVKDVTYHIGNLKSHGFVERIKMKTVNGLALDSRSGQLRTTARNCCVYKVTDNFKRYLKHD